MPEGGSAHHSAPLTYVRRQAACIRNVEGVLGHMLQRLIARYCADPQ
jgi:hypothetical protein